MVKSEYEEIVKNEVQRAISADEGAIARLSANYIDNVRAYTLKEKVKNKFTGRDESPDEHLMRSIEEKIDIPENRKDDFRREIMNFIGALAIGGSSYIFYFAAKLQEYADAETLKDNLELKAEELEGVFSAASPDFVIQEWSNVRPTFDSTRNRRGAFFNFADWEEHPMHTPADGIVKYWYEDQAQAMLDDLRAVVIEKQIRVFPRDLRAMLMIPSSAQYEGRNVDVEVAYAELSRLNFGINTAKMLLENNVKAVNRIWLWKPREATGTGGLLTYQTLGCHVFITLPDLVNFFESLRADDRYFSIEAVRLIYNQPGVDRRGSSRVQERTFLSGGWCG